MAKNELLPFADGEDANVLPTAQWEALTDILENGFQSGIAKSEQVNRVLAQGAVASYVLGQLIVDQLNKDATLDKDTLYQNIVKALQENAKDACLPLSGGTMTGEIVLSISNPIRSSRDDLRTLIAGATAWNKGAHLILSGKDESKYGGGVFEAVASDGTHEGRLIGDPEGLLRWQGMHVMCVPNYAAGVSIPIAQDYWTPCDGFIYYCAQRNATNEGAIRIWINGIAFLIRSNNYSWDTGMIPVKKNDGIHIDSWDLTEGWVNFYPSR